MDRPLSAPELYALSQAKECKGKERCYWCGSACDQSNTHDDPPPPIALRARANQNAKVPASPYVCKGCWLWGRKHITIQFMNGRGFQDRQAPAQHSWFITPNQAVVLRESGATILASGQLQDRELVYKYLLRPNGTPFTLALLTSGHTITINRCVVNQSSSGYTADTELTYTLNNQPYHYRVHELEEALRTGTNGKEHGVRLLLETLGPPPSGLVELSRGVPLKPGPGRPEPEQGQSLRKKV